MAVKAQDIPDLSLVKPMEHFRIFCDFFASRQGIESKSAHPVAMEMAAKSGPDYQIIALERAFREIRSVSAADLPDVIGYAIKQIPAPAFIPRHRLFCKIDKVQDFKNVEYLAGLDDMPVQEAGELDEIDAQPVVFETPPINAKLKNFRARLMVSRKVWVNNQKWLSSAVNAMRMAFYRKEATLVYAALEAGTAAHVETGADLDAVALAIEKFRGLTTSTGELIGAEPKYFICPATVENTAKLIVKNAGLNLEVIARSGLNASYLLADPQQQPAIILQTFAENGLPHIETKRPKPGTDNVATLDGFHDVNAVFMSSLCVVKLSN